MKSQRKRLVQVFGPFVARLLVLEVALCALCAVIAWTGLLNLATALIIGSLAVAAWGVSSLFIPTPTTGMVFLNGIQGFQAFNLLAEWGVEVPPGGTEAMQQEDMARANHAIPHGILLVAVGAVALLVAYLVTLI